ncbi:hypothetical protein ACSBR2_023529 [Camellia fascicularis]
MSGGFSPTDEPLSPTPDLDITIEEGSENSEQLLEEEGGELEIGSEEGGQFLGLKAMTFRKTVIKCLNLEAMIKCLG